MSQHTFKYYVALLTCLDKDGKPQGNLIRHHLKWLKECGVNGILVCGTTGEFPHLSRQQRQEYLDVVVEHNPGMDVMVHIGGVSLQDTLALQHHALSLNVPQLKSLLWMPPYYYDQDELTGMDEMIYTLLANQPESIPFYVYHLPKYTGIEFNQDFFEQFAFVGGMKDSAGDFDRMRQLIDTFPKKALFAGTDYQLQLAKSIGCHGFISGLANIFPHCIAQAFFTPNSKTELGLKKLRHIFTNSRLSKLAALKAYFNSLDLHEDMDPSEPILPIQRLTEPQHEQLMAEVEQVKDEFFSELST